MLMLPKHSFGRESWSHARAGRGTWLVVKVPSLRVLLTWIRAGRHRIPFREPGGGVLPADANTYISCLADKARLCSPRC